MRIERKYMAHYIQVRDEYVRLGEDLEEFTPEFSANVQKSKNILGENRVTISGYEKTVSVEPFYAQKGSMLFDYLQEIIDNNLLMEELKVAVLDVKLWEPFEDSTQYVAMREEAYIEVTSYGGDSSGYRIGFKLHYTGVKTRGLFDIVTNTFSELGE